MVTGRRVWQIVRAAVSVALVILILRTITLRDRVECTDGTVLVGTVEHQGPTGVTIRLRGGELRQLPAEMVARDPDTGGLRVQEGLLRVLRRVDVRLVVALCLSYSVVYLLVAVRWKLLLRAQGMKFGVGQLLRLNFIGMLFNNIMLGSLGGDVVKAYFVAQRTERKAAAVLTVFLDRMLGLVALATLCAVGTVTNLGQPQFRLLFLQLTVLMLLVVGGAAVFLSRRLRRFFHVERILRWLPFRRTVGEIDRALFIYRDRKQTLLAGFLLSIAVHLGVVTVNWALGWNLGLDARLTHYFSLVPVALFMAALPISISGWGVREWTYALLFSRLNPDNWTAAMALAVLFRVSTAVVWSLLGAVFLIIGERPSRAELERELTAEEGFPESVAPETRAGAGGRDD